MREEKHGRVRKKVIKNTTKQGTGKTEVEGTRKGSPEERGNEKKVTKK